MDESRSRTLRTLVELAEENSPNACWDDRRAVRLLRAQSTPDELRGLGVSERMIEHIFSETHAC
jgi:5-deoxy-D-glucuronate isomerase